MEFGSLSFQAAFSNDFPDEHDQCPDFEERLLHSLKKLDSDFKASFSAKLLNKGTDLRIISRKDSHSKSKNEETISLSKIGLYMDQLFYEMMLKSDSCDLEGAFLMNQKLMYISKFLSESTQGTEFPKIEVICKMNRIALFQLNGISKNNLSQLLEIIKLAKLNAKTSLFKNGQIVLDNVRTTLFSLKTRVRSLLCLSIIYSERLQHDKAILSAKKALLSNIQILQLTQCLSLYEENKFGRPKSIFKLIESLIDRVSKSLDIKRRHNRVDELKEGLLRISEQREETSLDLSFLSEPISLQNSYLNSCSILHFTKLGLLPPRNSLVSENLEDELEPNSLLEKISFLVISLYILATENRFKEQNDSVQSVFSRTLQDYYMPPSTVKPSELFLSKAVEISYLFLPDIFPFVSQIFNIFNKFELNRAKSIPENEEHIEYFEFLQPFKNGFKSDQIIPLIVQNTPITPYEYQKENINLSSQEQHVDPTAKKQEKPKLRVSQIKSVKHDISTIKKNSKQLKNLTSFDELVDHDKLNCIKNNCLSLQITSSKRAKQDIKEKAEKRAPSLKKYALKRRIGSSEKEKLAAKHLDLVTGQKISMNEKRAVSSELSKKSTFKDKKIISESNRRFPSGVDKCNNHSKTETGFYKNKNKLNKPFASPPLSNHKENNQHTQGQIKPLFITTKNPSSIQISKNIAQKSESSSTRGQIRKFKIKQSFGLNK